MLAHLWTEAPPPWEYVQLILCRDVYHCRPSELRREDLVTIASHLACLTEESRYQNRKQKGK